MMYGYGDWGIGAWIVMGLLMLLFWGGVATLVVLLVRWRGRTPWEGTGHSAPDAWNPEQILRERFARGEIDEAEFKARLEALRHLR